MLTRCKNEYEPTEPVPAVLEEILSQSVDLNYNLHDVDAQEDRIQKLQVPPCIHDAELSIYNTTLMLCYGDSLDWVFCRQWRQCGINIGGRESRLVLCEYSKIFEIRIVTLLFDSIRNGYN